MIKPRFVLWVWRLHPKFRTDNTLQFKNRHSFFKPLIITIMKLKIKCLVFQRNGIFGEPFYHCLAEMTDDKKRMMLITFTTEEDTQIKLSSCRAVDINDLQEKWRGDEIAYQLQAIFNKEMKSKGGTIYDCLAKSQLYTV